MPSESKTLLTDSERKYLELAYTEKFANADLMNAFIHIFIQQQPRGTLKKPKTGKKVPVSTCDRYLTKIFEAFETECPNLINGNIKGKSKTLAHYLKESANQELDDKDELITPKLLEADQNLKEYAKTLKKFYRWLKLESLSSEPNYSDPQMLLSGIFIPQTLRKSPPFLDIPEDLVPELEASGHIDYDYLKNIELRKAAYDDCPNCSVLEYMAAGSDHKHSVITGDPGSGKSTLVHYIAIDWVHKSDQGGGGIPLIIELRKYIQDQSSSFWEYLHQGESSICRWILKPHHLEDYLKDGRAFVIFDGLDEIFDQRLRETIVSQIIIFAGLYPIRVLVTSRKIGYRGELFRQAKFSEFTIEDLNENQIDDFSRQWHQIAFSDNSAEGEKYHRRLTQAIAESPAIRELARNPLLLTMMAILNRYRELPRKRYQLYEAASELLLKNWDVNRQIKDENLLPEPILMNQKQKVLQNIAHSMQHSKSNLITRNKLADIFAKYLLDAGINRVEPLCLASRIIDQLGDRNFILCLYGGKTYGFIHRTFLEFFCAAEFVYQFDEQKLTIDQICKQVLEIHWQDSTWHEVLRLLAGRLREKSVETMIRYLMDVSIDYQTHRNDFQQLKKSAIEHLLFAAELLNEVQNRRGIADTDRNLLEALKSLTEENLDVHSNLALTDIFEKVWQDNLALHDWLNSIPEGLIDYDEHDDLKSEKGADYQKLRDLLRAREWEAADYETNQIMCEAGSKEGKDYLSKSDIEAFPCADLQTINHLWTKYSAGKLGFTRQREIWLSTGGKPQSEYRDREEFNSFLLFAQKVGWFGDNILVHEQIYRQKYKLKNDGLHPLVHKPLGRSSIRGFGFSSVFFPRLSSCECYAEKSD